MKKIRNQFLGVIALLEMLVPGLDGVHTDHLSLLCCHFSHALLSFPKYFLGKQTDFAQNETPRVNGFLFFFRTINKEDGRYGGILTKLDLMLYFNYEVTVEDKDNVPRTKILMQHVQVQLLNGGIHKWKVLILWYIHIYLVNSAVRLV
jgi:hypothetical protein